MSRLALAGVLVLVIVAAGWGTYQYLKPPSYEKMMYPFTQGLKDADRVELEAVLGSETLIDKVVASKVLQGADAEKFLSLWRSQKFRYGPGMLCHSPAYRFRFYQNANQVVEATLCFHCWNIYFLHFKGALENRPYEVAFDPTSQEGRQLRRYLGVLFPGHDPHAETGD